MRVKLGSGGAIHDALRLDVQMGALYGPRALLHMSGVWAWRGLGFALVYGLLTVGIGRLSDVNDDAFISFRYARHLVEGVGLVFNQGERVEGYTNFLWTLLMAAGYALGFDLPRLSQVLGALAAAGTACLLVAFSRRRFADHPFALHYLAAGLLVTEPLFVHNAGNGLETTLFTLLVTASVLSWAGHDEPDGRPWRTGVLLGLSYLARPDAVLWLAVVGALDLVDMARAPARRAARLRCVVAYTAAFALLAVPHVAWRIWYYGDWVPNTYWVKGFSNWTWGARSLLEFGPAMGLMTAVALVVGPFVLRARWATCAALIVAIDLIFILRNGGGGGRYEVPLLPLVYLLLQETVGWVLAHARGRRPVWAGAAAAVVLALALVNVAHEWNGMVASAGFSRVSTRANVQLAHCLARATEPGDTVAVIAAGVLPYYLERPVVDMLGLNDRHIAKLGHVSYASPAGHQRFDAEYVIERRPRVVRISEASPRLIGAVASLLDSAEFRRRYVEVPFRCEGVTVPLFVDRERPLAES